MLPKYFRKDQCRWGPQESMCDKLFSKISAEKNLQIKNIYIYGSYINKSLVRNSNDVWFQKCLNWIVFSCADHTTIKFFENKTIEEDKKCQHIFKHTVVRNRFLCVINSTIYLRGIYRKIFFNLAEFLVGFWPLMLTLQSMQEGQ